MWVLLVAIAVTALRKACNTSRDGCDAGCPPNGSTDRRPSGVQSKLAVSMSAIYNVVQKLSARVPDIHLVLQDHPERQGG